MLRESLLLEIRKLNKTLSHSEDKTNKELSGLLPFFLHKSFHQLLIT